MQCPILSILRLEQPKQQGDAAREAIAQIVARLEGKQGCAPRNDSCGRPIAIGGLHWSIAHKDQFVAAIVADTPVGVDIEVIKPRSQTLFDFFPEHEWQQLGGRSWERFYRLWTAKEALSKKIGIGIDAMEHMRVIDAADGDRMIIAYQNQLHPVHVKTHHEYICSHTLS